MGFENTKYYHLFVVKEYAKSRTISTNPLHPNNITLADVPLPLDLSYIGNVSIHAQLLDVPSFD